MASKQPDQKPVFRVIDVLEAPHGGRILRLRLQGGTPPSVRDIKGARLEATSPDGARRMVTVEGFAVFGGKPSDKRLARTGRIDVHVAEEDSNAPPVAVRWILTPV